MSHQFPFGYETIVLKLILFCPLFLFSLFRVYLLFLMVSDFLLFLVKFLIWSCIYSPRFGSLVCCFFLRLNKAVMFLFPVVLLFSTWII